MSQESPINILSARVRQMIMEYKELRSKSESLSRDVDKLTAEIEKLKSQLYTQEQRYNALMTAKMLSVTDKDLEAAKMRINNLQRSVSHCITLLTEKESDNDGLSTE